MIVGLKLIVGLKNCYDSVASSSADFDPLRVKLGCGVWSLDQIHLWSGPDTPRGAQEASRLPSKDPNLQNAHLPRPHKTPISLCVCGSKRGNCTKWGQPSWPKHQVIPFFLFLLRI